MNMTYFFRYFMAILALVWMSSCTTRSEFPIVKKDVDPIRFQIVEDARAALGAKYGYGASGNKRYDCSGLVHRSEEHTSELQSRGHLVCRLLLEQKRHR